MGREVKEEVGIKEGSAKGDGTCPRETGLLNGDASEHLGPECTWLIGGPGLCIEGC